MNRQRQSVFYSDPKFLIFVRHCCNKRPPPSWYNIQQAVRKKFGYGGTLPSLKAWWYTDGCVRDLRQHKNQKSTSDISASVPNVLVSIRPFDPTDPAYRSPTIQRLRQQGMSKNDLIKFLGTTATNAQLMIDSLQSAGYNVEWQDGRYRILSSLLSQTVPKVLSYSRLQGREGVFGIVADPHVCSKQQRLDVLEAAYQEFGRQGVTSVYCVGNIIDGYREHINGGDVLFRNVTDQILYLADHYPQRTGITTYFISADCHEGWFAQAIGLNIGHHIEDECRRCGRKDLVYIGHIEADVDISNKKGVKTVMRLFHPGGGTAYAQSYQPQKIVESYQGGEKPQILVIGHYHKLGFFYPRGVPCVMAGCCQDQTRWMRGRHIDAHVGFVTLKVQADKMGAISSVTPKFVPFYDRSYHIERRDIWESNLAKIIG